MDETKVSIGDDVLLDIGVHSDWYISTLCYDNESVNVELRRKTDRYNEWWRAEQTEPQTHDIRTDTHECVTCRHNDEPWYSEACDPCTRANSNYEPQTEGSDKK